MRFSSLAFLAFLLSSLETCSSGEVAAMGLVRSHRHSNLFGAIATSTPIFSLSPSRPIFNLAQQGYSAVRGTKVSLIQPAGFTPADSFSGFQQLDTGASILVAEFPAPYPIVSNSFTTDTLKSRGMTLISKENVKVDGYSGLLMQVEQVANQQDFAKFILVFGDEAETVLLTASMPKDLQTRLAPTLKKSLLTAKWQKDKAVDPFADLPFAITSTPALKFSDRLINCLAYTQDGTMPVKSAAAPMLVACQSIGSARVSDREQFAKERLEKTALIEKISIESGKAIEINGIDGYEIIATASDSETKESIIVYQVLLFEPNSYYIIQGRVGSKLRSEYLDDFQIMAMSFKKKSNN
ncbi:MAG: DUF1653 domain-containing protein [Cyanosarcina radialis HA8281-LM2]|jgi:hypothetical protein|nr:DUF1653 domain-containing protein [Cyanosarcina radialis HA8281-LM2]